MNKITFIGGGNMSQAMISGLLSTDYPPNLIQVSDPCPSDKLTIQTFTNNKHAFFFSSSPTNVIILCVKPQVLKQVAEELSELILLHKPLVISIAAGIMTCDIQKWINPSSKELPAIIRVMPNTPALVNQGASCLYASNCNQEQKDLGWNLLKSISKSQYWVSKEVDLDAVTGISGSGPAYFFLMVECLVAAGVEAGLPFDVARGLASQTCLGAGQMLVSSLDDPAELRRKVTSPKGTTEAAITTMEQLDIRRVLASGIKAAIEKSAQLGIELGKL